MLQELIDQAERVLRHAPGSSLSADALHCTACAQTGVHVTLARFLAEIQALPHRFAVTHAPPLDEADVWSRSEKTAYAAALADAVLAHGPVVSLAANASPPGPDAVWILPRLEENTLDAVGAASDVADALRESLLELLRAAGDDASLRNAVGGAVAELNTVYATVAGRRVP
jgi:hypothetical protein